MIAKTCVNWLSALRQLKSFAGTGSICSPVSRYCAGTLKQKTLGARLRYGIMPWNRGLPGSIEMETSCAPRRQFYVLNAISIMRRENEEKHWEYQTTWVILAEYGVLQGRFD